MPAQHRGEDKTVHPPRASVLRVGRASQAGRSQPGTPPRASRQRRAPPSRVRWGSRTARRRSGSASDTAPAPPSGRAAPRPHDRQRVVLHTLALGALRPGADLLLVPEQGLPCDAVPVGSSRADRLDHQPDELVGDRVRSGLAGQPAACAASTYRRAVLGSTPARGAAFRSPAPSTQARSTSRTSTTLTSLIPTCTTSSSTVMTRASQPAHPKPPTQTRRGFHSVTSAQVVPWA